MATWKEAREQETEEAFQQYKMAVAKAGIAIYHYRLAGAPAIPQEQREEINSILCRYVRRATATTDDLEDWIMTGTLEEHGWGLPADILRMEVRELEKLARILDDLACPEIDRLASQGAVA